MKAAQDIIDQKGVEDEYEAILRAAMDGFLLVDVQGRLLDVNDAYCRLIGYSREELLQMHVQDIEASESSEQTAQHIHQIREVGRDRFETRHRHRDGRTLDMKVSVDYIDANGGRLLAFLRDITERKRMEEELRQSEQHWRTLFDHTLDGIALYDSKSGKVVLGNQAAADILGFDTSERIVGTTLLDRILEEDRELVTRAFAEDISNDLRKVSDIRVRTGDGRITWISILPTMISYQGRPAILLSARDITAQKQAEQALRDSEQKFKQLFTNLNDEVVFIDSTGKVLDVNERARDVSGYSRDEVIGRNVAELPIFSPDTLARVAELIAKASETQGVVEPLSDIPVIHKDGHKMYVQVSSCPIRAAQGELVGFCAIIRDITERKNAEEALRESEERFKMLFDNAPDAYCIRTPEGTFVDINKAAEQLAGISRKDIIGQTVKDLGVLSGEQSERAIDLQVNLGEQRFNQPYEFVLNRVDGTQITIEQRTFPVSIRGQTTLFTIAQDITQRKHAEAEMERRAQELARSNKELQTFAYVASHDLQEPLRMVSSYVQLLARRYKGRLDADADDFISYAVDGANRMQTMINDLLSYSRVGTRGKPLEPTDSLAVVSRAMANLQKAIEDNGAVVTTEPLPTVMADAEQLVQVFQNLIGNAIKFHGSGPPRVHISAERRPDEWLFSVRDNGIGIDPQYHERIFVMFQRLHSRDEYDGTGIGLAICKKIVDRHGGCIRVESEVGHGATFLFTIPIVGGKQA
jgi:PAS domain S-box-containing protein